MYKIQTLFGKKVPSGEISKSAHRSIFIGISSPELAEPPLQRKNPVMSCNNFILIVLEQVFMNVCIYFFFY